MRSAPHPFSLRQLQYALAIADELSFRKAAERCRVAQPSLSAQVALAERALGVQVFERGRGVRVSGAGTRLVEQARRVLVAAGDLQLLARHLGAAGVVTGVDFTFGKDRGGNVGVLKLLGQANRLSVDAVAPVADGEEIVSSSRIREALQAGDCETAARLLTRPFAIQGVVEHGDKRGRELGYPTANIPLGHYLRPRFGVYAVRGRLEDGRVLDGVANLGTRPMFDEKELLEPHFFDFDGDLYGQTIEVSLIHFLRDEQVFDGLDALTAQIGRDAEAAKRALSSSP